MQSMPWFLLSLKGFLLEQRDAIRLTARMADCRTRGHTEPTTIMLRGEFRVVCCRCGKELT